MPTFQRQNLYSLLLPKTTKFSLAFNEFTIIIVIIELAKIFDFMKRLSRISWRSLTRV